MSDQRIEVWHFLPDNKVPQWNYKRPCRVGQTLVAKGDIELCRNGLHGSRRAIDALQYAPGSVVTRCEIWGEVAEGDDKLVGRRRKVLAMADAGDALRGFACQCALDVVHLWDAPDVVVEYLKTKNEDLGDAARAAARDAAGVAAGVAARAAAGDAAGDAAGAAAWAEQNQKLEKLLRGLL